MRSKIAHWENLGCQKFLPLKQKAIDETDKVKHFHKSQIKMTKAENQQSKNKKKQRKLQTKATTKRKKMLTDFIKN